MHESDDSEASDLTLDECIAILSGSRGLHSILPWTYSLAYYPTRGIDRLGIPPLRFTDGPKGINLGRSTCFPVPIARGASWNTELEKKIGAAMAKEAAAHGANALGSTSINLIRHAGWGRAQESFGADPVLLGAMGAALMTGIQSEGVLAVIKHFACNSIEKNRFYVNVKIDERALYEIYLPHFKACADAGAAGFMSSYNRLNGKYCSQNSWLLHEVLKGDWNFQGFVMSDFILGTWSTSRSLNAGLDLEMPQTFWFGRRRILKAIRRGELTRGRVHEAAGRILRQMRRFGHLDGKVTIVPKSMIACGEHQDLALESARSGAVLLQNHNDVLPLKDIRSLAVIGPLACKANIGSKGSASVNPPVTTSLMEGLKTCLPDTSVLYNSGRNKRRAALLARECDAVIIASGMSGREEGEHFPFIMGGDRTRLELPKKQIDLIEHVSTMTARCIVVLFGGSAIACGDWTDKVNSILMGWYPGMHGGLALAEILTGIVNPSGRLPLSFPRRTEDLPSFHPQALCVEYDLYHDYRYFDRENSKPAFPFGHGLGYTTFLYSGIRFETISDQKNEPKVRITAIIKNTGKRDGVEIVQLYLSRPKTAEADHPQRELKAFHRCEIKAGESIEVQFEVDSAMMAWFNPMKHQWQRDAGVYTLSIGPNAMEQPLVIRYELPNFINS